MSSAASVPASAAATAAAPASPPARWSPATDLSRYDTILFDCDGVLWQEMQAVPGAAQTLKRLRDMGKLLLFATNNSGKSREAYLQKFVQLGFDAGITAEHIFTSSQTAAHYVASLPLADFDPSTQTVLTLGEAGIGIEMRARGFRTRELMEMFGQKHLSKTELAEMEIDPTIGCVVAGIDAELSYTKIAYASACLSRLRDAAGSKFDDSNRAVRPRAFISTNRDSSLPTNGHDLPGAGCCVSMLEVASGRKAVNMGKPERGMLDLAVESFKLDRQRVLMVGDRLDTDILFGIQGGVHSLLVTDTGINSEHDIARSGITPTFVLNNVTQLIDEPAQQ